MANALKLNLPPADSLFTTQEERDEAKLERVVNVPLSLIDSFPGHPFKVRMDAEMMEMIESVKLFGVLVPGLLRPKENGRYEVVAGHRRHKASEMAERETMPCIIRNLSDDEATMIMVDSNLQRETILPSEKAFAYKMKLDAMSRQGKRTDLTSRPMGEKWSVERISEQGPDSSRQIHRFIRLTNLIPQLLDMVDNSALKEKGAQQIALRPAVEISYLPQELQRSLFEAIEMDGCTPSQEQAIKMRKLFNEERLGANAIFSIMREEKPNQVDNFKIPREKIKKYFAPGTPAEKIEETIIKALEMYRQRERQRDDAR